jgi:hypothetical protein
VGQASCLTGQAGSLSHLARAEAHGTALLPIAVEPKTGYGLHMSRELPSHTGESRTPKFRKLPVLTIALCLAATIGDLAPMSRADVIDLQNGDRYNGKVLSVNTNSLVLQSDVLGTITLPRDKIALISLGTYATNLARRAVAVPGTARPPSLARTNGSAALPSTLREGASQAEMVQQVRSQLLGEAGPEANAKFDQMMAGVLSGKLSVADIRAEAKTTLDRARAMQKELGPEAGASLDGYLAVLDHFLAESGPSSGALTNLAAPTSPKLKPRTLIDDE